MKKYFNFLILITGCVLGAGFVSGSEISMFFAQYGKWAYLLIFIFAFLFFVSDIKILKIKNKYNISNLTEFSILIFGKHYKVFNILITVCYLFFAGVMLSGIIFLTNIYCALIIFVVGIVLSFFNISNIVRFNYFIIPSIIIIIIFTYFEIPNLSQFGDYSSVSWKNILFIFDYSAVNIVLSIGAILGIEDKIENKSIYYVPFLSSLALFIIGLIYITILQSGGGSLASMPMLSLVNGNLYTLYYLLLIASIVSSLFLGLYSIKNQIFGETKNLFIWILLIVLIFCLGLINFENILLISYLIGGMISIMLLLCVFMKKTN